MTAVVGAWLLELGAWLVATAAFIAFALTPRRISWVAASIPVVGARVTRECYNCGCRDVERWMAIEPVDASVAADIGRDTAAFCQVCTAQLSPRHRRWLVTDHSDEMTDLENRLGTRTREA